MFFFNKNTIVITKQITPTIIKAAAKNEFFPPNAKAVLKTTPLEPLKESTSYKFLIFK